MRVATHVFVVKYQKIYLNYPQYALLSGALNTDYHTTSLRLVSAPALTNIVLMVSPISSGKQQAKWNAVRLH